MKTQYILVFLIITASVGWIIYRVLKKDNKNTGGCCGCALSQNCNKPKNIKHQKEKCPD